MVDNKGSVVASPLPSGVSDATASLIESADRVDGSVILFDAQDKIVWVNERQRTLMPCTDYVNQTYSSLFWSALKNGLVGNALAASRPQMWLEFSALERATRRLSQTVNRYAWGDMALTHRRFDDGTSIQIRFATSGADADSPERLLLDAVEARREATSLRHALDNLDVGVGVIDGTGLPAHSNASLENILSQDMGLLVGDKGRIKPAHPEDHSLWQSALAMAAAGYAPTTMMLPSGDEPPLLVVTVFPGAHAGTAIVLAAPLRPGFTQSHIDGLSEAFGMPPDEAAVMMKLASGQSLQEIASQLRAERDGNVVSPFSNVANVRHTLRRHNLTAESQAQIAALVLRVAAITRVPTARYIGSKEELS